MNNKAKYYSKIFLDALSSNSFDNFRELYDTTINCLSMIDDEGEYNNFNNLLLTSDNLFKEGNLDPFKYYYVLWSVQNFYKFGFCNVLNLINSCMNHGFHLIFLLNVYLDKLISLGNIDNVRFLFGFLSCCKYPMGFLDINVILRFFVNNKKYNFDMKDLYVIEKPVTYYNFIKLLGIGGEETVSSECFSELENRLKDFYKFDKKDVVKCFVEWVHKSSKLKNK